MNSAPVAGHPVTEPAPGDHADGVPAVAQMRCDREHRSHMPRDRRGADKDIGHAQERDRNPAAVAGLCPHWNHPTTVAETVQAYRSVRPPAIRRPLLRRCEHGWPLGFGPSTGRRLRSSSLAEPHGERRVSMRRLPREHRRASGRRHHSGPLGPRRARTAGTPPTPPGRSDFGDRSEVNPGSTVELPIAQSHAPDAAEHRPRRGLGPKPNPSLRAPI